MLGPDDLVLCAAPLLHVGLLDRLAPARAAGFTGISLTPADVWGLEEQGMSAREIAQRIEDAGLKVAEMDCTACWLPCQRTLPVDDGLAALLASLTPERVVDTAARIGARSITAVEMRGVKPSLDEAAEAFARLCDLAAPHGLKVHIEFLPFGGIPDLTAAWNIVQAAGRENGGLTIDAWHLFRSNSTLAQLAAIPGARIFSVQINDAPAIPDADLLKETMSARLLPGAGSFNLTGFIRTLDRIGSQAPIGVEVFSDAQAARPLAEVAREWARTGRASIEQARKI